MVYQVNGSRVEWNPSPARLCELTEEMPNASVTEFGNVNVKARVDSRSTRSTYLVDDSANSRGQTITRAEYERVAGKIPGVDDIEILQPRRRYERQGRAEEYDAMVARLKQERKEFLGSFPGLDESLVKSLG